jgi:hypothetical protein
MLIQGRCLTILSLNLQRKLRVYRPLRRRPSPIAGQLFPYRSELAAALFHRRKHKQLKLSTLCYHLEAQTYFPLKSMKL